MRMLAVALLLSLGSCRIPNLPPTPRPTPDPVTGECPAGWHHLNHDECIQDVPTPEPTPCPPVPECPAGEHAEGHPWLDCTVYTCVPNPPPPPPPPSSVAWTQTTDEDVCVASVSTSGIPAPSPLYLADVERVTSEIEHRAGEDERTWYSRLVPGFEARGLSVALYGEELAVARVSGASENYDRLTAAGEPRTGIGSFRSRCFPATRSEPLPVAGTPPPTGYPRPVTQVKIKVHTPSSERADGLAIMDGVAQSCGPNPDFAGRLCWPSCGPEGTTEEEKQARVACDVMLAPRWLGAGHSHATNPWLYHGKPGADIQACVGSVCSPKVRAQ